MYIKIVLRGGDTIWEADAVHVTIGRKAWKGKIVYVECRKNGWLERVDNKDESFLMVVLFAGKMSFQINGAQHFAEAPCFLCFD